MRKSRDPAKMKNRRLKDRLRQRENARRAELGLRKFMCGVLGMRFVIFSPLLLICSTNQFESRSHSQPPAVRPQSP